MPAVRKFMTVNPVSVDIDQSIVAAARLMRDHDVGILPVTSNGELVGVVTDRDIVVRAIAAGQFDTPVKAAVTGGIASLAPDDDERQAAVLMSEHDVRRLPVADGGRLVGMVSIGDVAARADSALAGRILRNTGPDRLSGGAALGRETVFEPDSADAINEHYGTFGEPTEPNEESRLEGDESERFDIDQFVPDGLTDEANIEDPADG